MLLGVLFLNVIPKANFTRFNAMDQRAIAGVWIRNPERKWKAPKLVQVKDQWSAKECLVKAKYLKFPIFFFIFRVQTPGISTWGTSKMFTRWYKLVVFYKWIVLKFIAISGNFEPLQCHSVTGLCHCVHPISGQKVNGSRLNSHPNQISCHHSNSGMLQVLLYKFWLQ